MIHLDLFSGIGGNSLAVEQVWPDIEHVFCEIDPFCQAVLRKHWPESKIYGDIRNLHTTFSPLLLTGGFPCQPFSTAGKRLAEKDDRFLWPEMLRVITEAKPRWVVGENVDGIISLAVERICTEMEAIGYEIWPIDIPACSVGAQHRRNRVWFIAHLNSIGCLEGKNEKPSRERGEQTFASIDHGNKKKVSDNNGQRMERKQSKEIQRIKRIERRQTQFRIASEFRGLDAFEPKLCRTLYGIPNGVDRIKALGNSIVPQVAIEIFRAIKEIESNLCPSKTTPPRSPQIGAFRRFNQCS